MVRLIDPKCVVMDIQKRRGETTAIAVGVILRRNRYCYTALSPNLDSTRDAADGNFACMRSYIGAHTS